MQVLKEEVRAKILKAARAEFKEKGFQRSSMRNIAGRAGMTAGNLYRYFENKEELFYAVTNPAFDKIVELVDQNKKEEFKNSSEFNSFMEYITGCIGQIYEDYKDELTILVDGSKGTSHEHAKENMIDLFENRLKQFLKKGLAGEGIVIQDQFIFHLIAASYIDSFIKILKHYEDREQMREMISQCMRFYLKDIFERFR